MRTRRSDRELSDFEWRMLRDHAELVACPRCNAGTGEPCRNAITGDELRSPAHFQRINAAKETP